MRFTYRSRFRCTPETLFAFHERPDALPLLTPPGAGVRVIKAAPSLAAGAEARLSVPLLGPIRTTWVARHTVYDPPRRFVDEQIEGPFKSWRHEHIIEPADGGAELIEVITYALPMAPLSRLAQPLVRRMLSKMFAYRHEVTRRYVETG